MPLTRNSGCKITTFYLIQQIFLSFCGRIYSFLCNFALEMRKKEISILIPVYNDMCVDIVKKLAGLCEKERAYHNYFIYEIIVADDASPNKLCVEKNAFINKIANCSFIVKEANSGSAATRNFLAKKSRYQWLLFLDCDMKIVRDDFISCYLDNNCTSVINGGICIAKGDKHNLRCLYETHCAPMHQPEKRAQRPYQSFRSTNFMIERSVMLEYPFDERFKKSGYEDVMFGKVLKDNHVSIAHIDNPTMMVDFEDNTQYMEKIERSLRTLYAFKDELRGYSHLLTLVGGIHINAVFLIIRVWHTLFGAIERKILCSHHPILTIFNIYRLGYYLSLTKKRLKQ